MSNCFGYWCKICTAQLTEVNNSQVDYASGSSYADFYCKVCDPDCKDPFDMELPQ